jgi:hypothetical protein
MTTGTRPPGVLSRPVAVRAYESVVFGGTSTTRDAALATT